MMSVMIMRSGEKQMEEVRGFLCSLSVQDIPTVLTFSFLIYPQDPHCNARYYWGYKFHQQCPALEIDPMERIGIRLSEGFLLLIKPEKKS